MDPENLRGITSRGVAVTVAFIVVIQVAAMWFTSVNEPITSQAGATYAPAGTSAFGSLLNALILIAAVFATTIVAVWLIRSKRVRVFTSVIFVGTALALFLLTLLTAIDLTQNYMNEDLSLYLSLALAAGVVVVLGLTTKRTRFFILAPFITGLLSAEVGSYFASSLNLFTALLLPVVFSVYDIYAVFRGPLKQLVTSAPAEVLAGVTSRLGEFAIGTGDTIFYSLLPSIALIQFGLGLAVATMFAVDAGVVITLYLLTRSKMLPGLPIPMALGLAVIVVYAAL
ncbi:MAG: hypothetical protein OK456_05725 [Thaumarchaeota archaeon]|nr:hypothetical protein [Nitrososphaerota archaeon]